MAWIAVLDGTELLQDAHDGEAGLGEGHVLSRADAGPAAKGEVVPVGQLQGLPALGAEDFGVGAVDLDAFMERVKVHLHVAALFHVHGRGAGGAAAGREDGVVEGDARGLAHGRGEAEGFVDHATKVLEAFDAVEGQFGIAQRDDFLPELGVHLRVAREVEEAVGQKHGDGVVAGEEHVQ